MAPITSQPDCAEWVSGPAATAYRTLDPGETPTEEASAPAPTASLCLRYREPAYRSWESEDGLTWTAAATLPERGRQLPDITVPIPASSYGLAGTGDAVLVSNPTFGDMVWFSPAGEFAQR